MPVNWQDKAVQDRLLTAFIASVDNKVNVAEIARLCGGDMTYHAVENYLRKFRREAKVMKSGGQAPAATSSPVKPTATPKKGRNVSPTKDGVKSGRIEKKNPATPKVKKEVVEDEAEDMVFGDDAGEDEEEMQTEI